MFLFFLKRFPTNQTMNFRLLSIVEKPYLFFCRESNIIFNFLFICWVEPINERKPQMNCFHQTKLNTSIYPIVCYRKSK